MRRLLIVHHTPTSQVRALCQAVIRGATVDELRDDLTVLAMPALRVTPQQMAAAAGVVVVTPVNFGALAGATKHAFDRSFRTLDGTSANRPWAAVVKGSTDATGAVRQLESIVTGLRWRAVAPTLAIEGDVTDEHLATAQQLGSMAGATLIM